jgi:hypothetical protein
MPRVGRPSLHTVYGTRRKNTDSVHTNSLRTLPLLYRTSVRCITGAFSKGAARSLDRREYTYDKDIADDSGGSHVSLFVLREVFKGGYV